MKLFFGHRLPVPLRLQVADEVEQAGCELFFERDGVRRSTGEDRVKRQRRRSAADCLRQRGGETAKTLDDCLCGANCQESSETVNRGYFLKRTCISTDADHEISQSGTNTRLLRTPGSVGIREI